MQREDSDHFLSYPRTLHLPQNKKISLKYKERQQYGSVHDKEHLIVVVRRNKFLLTREIHVYFVALAMFFVTRWLEEERLSLLASVVMVRSDIALLGTRVMKKVASIRHRRCQRQIQ